MGALAGAGVMVNGDGLQLPHTSTTVRVRGGQRMVQDGPVADTKEHLGGYAVIRAESLDDALALGRAQSVRDVRPRRHRSAARARGAAALTTPWTPGRRRMAAAPRGPAPACAPRDDARDLDRRRRAPCRRARGARFLRPAARVARPIDGATSRPPRTRSPTRCSPR